MHLTRRQNFLTMAQTIQFSAVPNSTAPFREGRGSGCKMVSRTWMNAQLCSQQQMSIWQMVQTSPQEEISSRVFSITFYLFNLCKEVNCNRIFKSNNQWYKRLVMLNSQGISVLVEPWCFWRIEFLFLRKK